MMVTRIVLLLVAFCFASSVNALFTPNEYNIWRYQEGVLYGATQNEFSEPVLVSLAGPGTPWANMVISLTHREPCEAFQSIKTLLINKDLLAVTLSCVQAGEHSVVSYTLHESEVVNRLYRHLKSGFTLVIDGRIKLWAANIAHPAR
ncbi:TPA: hypothetical protein I9786_002041 [Serratia marcescens]|nr:hypothetical protein [Serratia marcescens]HAT5028718.1 hypothetical protein [Serratia marcescens]